MDTYALFDNGTAELIIIKLLNVEVKETLDIYFQIFRSPKVKESAKRGIECAYETIFSKDINAYLQKAPISVTVKDFSQQVDGSSAGIAYAIAFASALIKDNIIAVPANLPDKVAATGEVDNRGNIKEIRNIREKILGAITQNADIMFYPRGNSQELKLLLEKEGELKHAVKDSGIKLRAVDSIKQLFCEIGILPQSLFGKASSVENTEIVASNGKHDILSLTDDLKVVPSRGKKLQIQKLYSRTKHASLKVFLALILIVILLVSGMLYLKLLPSDVTVASNLALNKMAYSSSNETSLNIAPMACDGKPDTRWSSDYSDIQSIYVDLGVSRSISCVVLKWDEAYAKQYQIQVSKDGEAWSTVYTNNLNQGGVNLINFKPTDARFVKMYAWERATVFGYSLWEFEVYVSEGDINKSSNSAPTLVTHENSPFSLIFEGDWDLITSQEYKDNLVEVFYSVYPRLYKRWGKGTAPKTITFKAVNDDTIAASYDTTIEVGVDFANNNPNDLGYFTHELTHQAQSYKDTTYPTLVYPNGSKIEWWIESLASYGGFRYFHWTNEARIQIMDYKKMAKVSYNSNGSVYRFDWLGEAGVKDEGSVDKIQWFFAWLDYNYPTTKDANGNIVPGLIDTVNTAVKNNTYNDEIFVNKTTYTMFELMEKYTKDVNQNGWRFTGFENFKDNWLAEDIDGVENPEYPTNLPKTLDSSLMEYFNYNYTIEASEGFEYGYQNIHESAANLFDNNVNTKFCTDIQNPYVIFAMNQPVTVTSYTLTTGNDTSIYTERNPECWKLYGSNDKNSWNTIHSVSQASRTMEAVNRKPYKFVTDNSKSYQYYKLEITSLFSGQTIQLSELSLNGNLSLMDYFDTTINATEGFDQDENAPNLFDSNISTKYCTATSTPFVIFSMKQPVKVKSYVLTTGDDTADYTGRNPDSWILYGSNDQNNWHVISKVSQASNIMKPINYKQYKFTTDTSQSYKYYKLEITSSLSGSEIQLSDFSLYAD